MYFQLYCKPICVAQCCQLSFNAELLLDLLVYMYTSWLCKIKKKGVEALKGKKKKEEKNYCCVITFADKHQTTPS